MKWCEAGFSELPGPSSTPRKMRYALTISGTIGGQKKLKMTLPCVRKPGNGKCHCVIPVRIRVGNAGVSWGMKNVNGPFWRAMGIRFLRSVVTVWGIWLTKGYSMDDPPIFRTENEVLSERKKNQENRISWMHYSLVCTTCKTRALPTVVWNRGKQMVRPHLTWFENKKRQYYWDSFCDLAMRIFSAWICFEQKKRTVKPGNLDAKSWTCIWQGTFTPVVSMEPPPPAQGRGEGGVQPGTTNNEKKTKKDEMACRNGRPNLHVKMARINF